MAVVTKKRLQHPNWLKDWKYHRTPQRDEADDCNYHSTLIVRFVGGFQIEIYFIKVDGVIIPIAV
jgi:hypothetical protein